MNEKSSFEQGELLLTGLSIKDENLMDEAIKVVEKFGNYKNALKAASGYDYMNGTKILFKLLGETENDDEVYLFARQCSSKFHAIDKFFSEKSVAEGSDYNALVDNKDIDYIKTFSLDIREAWTLYFVGGREFIKNLRFVRDGDEVIRKLISAIHKADKHIQSEQTLMLSGGGREINLLGSFSRG